MIITLVGNNAFALRRRLNKLISAFINKHGELSVERIDAEEAEAQAIFEAIDNLPLLASKKLVIVRNLSSNKAAAEQIEQIIGSTTDSVDLVLYEPTLDKRRSYFKVLKKQTAFEEYNELDSSALATWLVEEAKKLGGKLSLADAHYLINRVGGSQELLANELDKLLLYDLNISKNSIDLLTEATPQSRIFELLDAAFTGQKQQALKLYDEQRAQRVEPQAILAMIAWQLELIVLAKYATDRPIEAIARDIGAQSYPIRKAANLAGKLNEKQIKNMVEQAFEIDRKSKTVALDMDEALKTYIVTL